MTRVTSILFLAALAAAAHAAPMTTDVTRIRPERALADELSTLVIEYGALVSNADDPMDLRIGDGKTPGGVRIGIPVPLSTDFRGRTIEYGEGWASRVWGGGWRLEQEGEPYFLLTERVVNALVSSVYVSSGRVYVVTAWDGPPALDSLILRWTDGSSEWSAVTNDINVVADGESVTLDFPQPPASAPVFAVSYVTGGPTLFIRTVLDSRGLVLDGQTITNWSAFATAGDLSAERSERTDALGAISNRVDAVEAGAAATATNLLALWLSYSNLLDGGIDLTMLDTASLDSRYATTGGVAATYLARTGGVVRANLGVEGELHAGGTTNAGALYVHGPGGALPITYHDGALHVGIHGLITDDGDIPLARILGALAERGVYDSTAPIESTNRITLRYGGLLPSSMSLGPATVGPFIVRPMELTYSKGFQFVRVRDDDTRVRLLYLGDGVMTVTAPDDVSIPLRVQNGITIFGGDDSTNSLGEVSITVTGGLRVGRASFHADLSGNIWQDATNTAALGLLSAESLTLGGVTIADWSRFATGAPLYELDMLWVSNGLAVVGGVATSAYQIATNTDARLSGLTLLFGDHTNALHGVVTDLLSRADAADIEAGRVAGQAETNGLAILSLWQALGGLDFSWASNGLAAIGGVATSAYQIATNADERLSGLTLLFGDHTNALHGVVTDLLWRADYAGSLAGDARDDALRIESNLTYLIELTSNAATRALTGEVGRVESLIASNGFEVLGLWQALGGLDFSWASNGLAAIGGVATSAYQIATNADARASSIIGRYEAWTNSVLGWMSDYAASLSSVSGRLDSAELYAAALETNLGARIDAATNDWHSAYTNEAALREEALAALSNALAQLDAAIGIVSNLTVSPDAALLGGYSEAAFMRESSWQSLQTNLARVIGVPLSNSAPGGVGRRAGEYRDGQFYEYAWYPDARGTNTPGWIRTPPGNAGWTNSP